MLKKKKRRSRTFKDNSRVIDIEEARTARRKRRDEATEKKNRAKRPKNVVNERRAGKIARRRMVYFIIFLAIACIIGVSAFHIVSLKLTEAKTMDEQKALLKQKERLEYEYSQLNNPEYIEQQARQQLKMIKPGEILYVLPEKKKATTSSGIIPE